MSDTDVGYKVFNDVVHGHMTFHPLLVAIVDTPQFQRLRNLKQLGSCYFVCMSACHNRFEHCLGTSFIAGKLLERLKARKLVEITDEDQWEKQKLCVEIAGLCHDIGHGPFSHTWEHFRKKVNKNDTWKHEEESVRILDEVLKERISPTKNFGGKRLTLVKDAFEYYGLNDKDVDSIKTMIRGDKSNKNYLFQIVNNVHNKIDVDKWEYLCRDSVMLNTPVSFAYKRLLHFCAVIKTQEGDEELCYREKECAMLLEMFLSRAKLHIHAYQHPKVVIIDEMLTDALVLANERLKLTKTPVSLLTDHIFYKILYEDFGNDEKMKKAKEILRRIVNRNFYRCITKESFEEKIPNIDEIKTELSNIPGIEPFIDDLVMAKIEVDMTKANRKETLRNVLVYQKTDNDELSCSYFNWNKFEDSLKIDMKNLKKLQLLLLYKQDEDLPEKLEEEIVQTFKKTVMSKSKVQSNDYESNE